MKSSVGGKIRCYRERKGWTQWELGERCGMADSQIGVYERGEVKPRRGTLERIAQALGVTVDALLDKEGGIGK